MQSHFVKLEPPYQIIHYGGVVGIQIGTLIVVGQEYPGPGDSIDIYTRSHPVVSYVDKNLFKRKMDNRRADLVDAAYWGGGEGNVWSKVQVNDVDVLGLWDADQQQNSYPFEWDDFVGLVSTGFSRIDAIQNKHRKNGLYDLMNYLEKVGFDVVLPDPVEHLKMTFEEMTFEVEYGRRVPGLHCSTTDGLIEFYLPFYEKDPKHVVPMVVHFLQQYLTIMRSPKATIEFFNDDRIYGEHADDDEYPHDEAIDKLVKVLNDTYNDELFRTPF